MTFRVHPDETDMEEIPYAQEGQRERVGSISAPFTMAEALRQRTDGFNSTWSMMLSREEIVFWEGVFRRSSLRLLSKRRWDKFLTSSPFRLVSTRWSST